MKTIVFCFALVYLSTASFSQIAPVLVKDINSANSNTSFTAGCYTNTDFFSIISGIVAGEKVIKTNGVTTEILLSDINFDLVASTANNKAYFAYNEYAMTIFGSTIMEI